MTINSRQVINQFCPKFSIKITFFLSSFIRNDIFNYYFLINYHEHSIKSCIKYCLKNHNLEWAERFIETYIQTSTTDPEWIELLRYVIHYLPPEKLRTMVSLFEKYKYDIKALETRLIRKSRFFPDSYKAYYDSLSPEEQLQLPLQKWWELRTKKWWNY